MTKVEDIVKSYLVTNGYDGIYNDMGKCGCTFDDFASCEYDCSKCQPGYKFDCGRCKNSPANDGDCEEPGEFEDTFIICKDKNICAPLNFGRLKRRKHEPRTSEIHGYQNPRQAA